MQKELDTSRPHTGRVYDYLLGGTCNFEADRKAAEMLLKVIPHARTMAQLNRWFLQFVAARWEQEGVAQVLDLASGLPTQGHFNDQLPNARILFSDHDPLNVSYAEDLLKDRPNARYVLADLRTPDELMRLARTFFRQTEKLAVGLVGISYFLDDASVQRLSQSLFDLAPSGSLLSATFIHKGAPQLDERLVELYRRLVQVTCSLRSVEDLSKLLAPWRVVECKPLIDFLDMADQADIEHELVPTRRFFGLFAVKD